MNKYSITALYFSQKLNINIYILIKDLYTKQTLSTSKME